MPNRLYEITNVAVHGITDERKDAFGSCVYGLFPVKEADIR